MKKKGNNSSHRKNRTDNKEHEKSGRGGRKAGTSILMRIVALVIIIFIATGLFCFLFFRNSQNTLINKSKSLLVESRVDLISSPNAYLVDLMSQILLLSTPGGTQQTIQADIAEGVSGKQITAPQETMDGMLKEMIDSGLFDYKLAFFALPAESGLTTSPEIIMSSDKAKIYEEVPDILTSLVGMSANENTRYRARINDNNSYMLTKKGIPELGLEGEFLVNAYRYSPESWPGEVWYFSFSSMHDDLADIDAFYTKEQYRTNLIMILLMGGAAVALIIITYFLLNVLIRRRITKPINELSRAASEVIEGDIDIQVPVRHGEEFEGLKKAFNEMVASLRMVINKSVEGSTKSDNTPAESADSGNKKKHVWRSGRSSILLEVTILVLIIFIITGAVALLLAQRSQSRLYEKTREKVIQSTAETICSGHGYVSSLISRYYNLMRPIEITEESGIAFFQSLLNKEVGEVQTIMSGILRDLKEKGLHGIEIAMEVFPEVPGLYPNYTVFAASDEKFLYTYPPEMLLDLYQMPKEDNKPLRARIDKDNTYMFFEDGIPEMGLENEYLVTTYRHSIEPSGEFPFWFFDFKPMHEELSTLNELYNKENADILVFMSIITGIAIIVVTLITFFYLSFLIRRDITAPVDELSAAAEEVMNGNIDIQVPITPGEELEDLKKAFNLMLSSLNEIIERGSSNR